MKSKLIFLMAVLLMCSTGYCTSAFDIQWWNQQTYSNLPGNTLRQWAEGMEGRVDLNPGRGEILYVDSNVDNEGDGSSWSNAYNTLDEAVSAADPNSIIYIAQGHSETMGAAADEVDIDVAGLTIIGLGNPGVQPKFDYSGGTTTAAFTIGADNVTLYNLRFHANVTDVSDAIQIQAGSVGVSIIKCVFDCETEGTDEFHECIKSWTATNDRLSVLGCEFDMAAGGAQCAIAFKDCDYTEIAYNKFSGDYAVADVNNATTASNHISIHDNYILNGTIGGATGLNAQPCIELLATTSGVIVDNYLICNVATPDAAIVGADMWVLNNWYTETEGGASGAPMWLTTDTADNIIGFNDADNAASTSSVAANADGSIVERLEQLNQDFDALTGMVFRGTCTTNAVTTTVISSELGGFGEDFFNTGWVIICTYDASGAGTAPEGEVRDITDYATATGTFTVAAFSAALTANDEVLVRRVEDINPHDPAMLETSGNIWYVDDGGSNGDGKTWQSAKTTLTAAEALCSAGDTILVGRNHNENLSTGGDTINIAGVSVIGMGYGDARPLFDCDADSDELTLDNSGITLKNLRFRPGANQLTSCVRVEDAGIGCVIDNCAFIDGEAAGTDEWIDVISVDTLASNLTVKNCTFYNSGQGTGTFVNLDEATIANASILNNVIYGDFAEAPIWGAAAVPTNLLIKNNVITNLNSGEYAIEFQGAATGVIADNRVYTDALATAIDPGSCSCYENYAVNTTDLSSTRVPESSIDSILFDAPRVISDTTSAMTAGNGYGAADDPVIFTVTGDILCRACCHISTQITSTSNDTLELGVAGNTACLLVQDTADGTAFDAGDDWSLITAADNPGAQLADEWLLIGGGADIVLTINDHDLTAGVATFYLFWIPLSSDAAVVGAAP